MTIAIGFQCPDGIVLCADTQYTEGGVKYYRTKLHGLEFSQGKLAFAIAGSVDFALMTINKIKSEIGASAFTKMQITKCMEAALLSVYREHLYPHPRYSYPDGPSFSLLVGMWSKSDALCLWAATETSIMEVEQFRCIGSGRDLGQSLADVFYEPTMRADEAVVLGSYIIMHAKKHVEGCGGDTQIRVLKNDGRAQKEDPIYTREREAYLDEFDQSIQRLFYACGTLDLPDDVFDFNLQKFEEDARGLKKRRLAFRKMIEDDKDFFERLDKKEE